MKKLFFLVLVSLFFVNYSYAGSFMAGSKAKASSTMIVKDGDCPRGSSDTGNGYCSSDDGKHFMPTYRNSSECPTGSSYAGSGYCRANSVGVSFIPSNEPTIQGNFCPNGGSYANAGYCRIGG